MIVLRPDFPNGCRCYLLGECVICDAEVERWGPPPDPPSEETKRRLERILASSIVDDGTPF